MKRSRVSLSVIFMFSVILLLGGMEAVAAPLTFDFTYSGADFNNSAVATGFITFNDALLPNPGELTSASSNLATILDLSITVSNAKSGNGTFSLADFKMFTWSTAGATLDFTKELVGQPTNYDPWGTWNGSFAGSGGEFNFFAISAPAPTGVYYFALETNGGIGDNNDDLVLRSMKARSVSVPEPATMLLLGLGIIGLAGIRRKIKE